MLQIVLVLLWTVLGLLALAALALALPWSLALAAASAPARLRLEVRPFSARLPAILALERGLAADRRPGAERPRAPRTHRPKRGRRRAARSGTLRRMARAAPALVSGLIGRFTLDEFSLEGRIGLDDPAETGQLFGLLAPLSHMPKPPGVAVRLWPCFERACLEGEAALRVRVVPLLLLFPVAGFAWRVFVVRA